MRPVRYPTTAYAAAVTEPTPRARLIGDLTADLVIVGGGFTGLSTALHAAEHGLEVVLLEGERLGWGASGRNGGQVVPGFAAELDTIAGMVGSSAVRPLWDLGVAAVTLLWGLIDRHGIACEATRGHMMVATKARHLDALSREAERLEAWGYTGLSLIDRNDIRDRVGSQRYVGGRLDPHGGHVQPLLLAQGLAQAAERGGARLFEGTQVERLDGSDAVTATGRVRARHAILAGNAYLGAMAPTLGRPLDRKALTAATYMIATAPLGPERARQIIRDDVAVCDTNHVLDYYRLSKDHRLLFGAELTTKPCADTWTRRTLRRRMLRVFPQLNDVGIDHAWSGMIDLSTSRMPHLGRLGPKVLFAQGFSGHGVALTQLAGKLMADAVVGNEAAFEMLARLPAKDVPGGRLLRGPMLRLARSWFRLQDLF